MMRAGGEFFVVNTCDMLISLLQMWALVYYFRQWRQISKSKALDSYISITFTCLALATLSRLAGTSIKCVTNYIIWVIPKEFHKSILIT